MTPEQNFRLTRVEGDAPMGAMMRENFWIPFALDSQLEAGGAPRRIRLLGKDYAAFRADDGRIGFLDERCPHRGASLVLARTEGCELRCIFHGWKIDVTGQVTEAATHTPNAEEFASRIKMRRYPVHEAGGLLWVYLGDGALPAVPDMPFTRVPRDHVWVSATHVACNWLQGVEGTLDSAHVGTLHRSWIERSVAGGQTTIGGALTMLAPSYEVEATGYGLRAAALRPQADGSTFVRVTEHIVPFVSIVPSTNTEDGNFFIACPVDDTHHILFWGHYSPTEPMNINSTRVQLHLNDPDLDINNLGRFHGDRDNNWAQDRAAMAEGHFSGFTSTLLQEDVVVQLSMGPIADRSLDHLSSSDVAVARLRALLLRAVEQHGQGAYPLAGGPVASYATVQPVNVVLPKGGDWRTANQPIPA